MLEARFPVVLRQFSLRPGSGGAGRFRGGDGVVREIEFLRPLTVNILSERRVHAPWGLHGGGDGKRGVNRWIRHGGQTINLGGRNSFLAERGDRIVIETPGGGGYGMESEGDADHQRAAAATVVTPAQPAAVRAGSFHNFEAELHS